MIIILKKGTAPQKVNEMVSHFEQMNFQVQEIRGVHETIVGIIGDTSRVDIDIVSNDAVEDVKRSPSLTRRPTGNSIRRTPSSASSARLGKP